MLKDINGVEVPNNEYNEEITIRYLLDLMSDIYTRKEKRRIIGFARYNPIRINEHRFAKQLNKGSWYPIERFSKKEKNVFNLLGYYNSHFGLFDHIIPLKGHEHKFEHLKKTNPDIAKYWSEKEQENKDFILSLEKSKQLEKLEREEYAKIKERIGNKPPRLKEVNQILNGSKVIKRSEFFRKMVKEPKFKLAVEADLNFRSASLHIYKNTPKDRSYRLLFQNGMDYKSRNIIKDLLEQIKSFDFKTMKEVNKMAREERFEKGEASILDILSKKTEEITHNITKLKTKKRKI